MATINTTTINGVPEIVTELTGDENILIQQAPNSNIMGKRTLNNLKSFFGVSNEQKTNGTMVTSDSTNGVLHISGNEFAKTTSIKTNINTTKITTDICTEEYTPKTQEQLYIHYFISSPNVPIKNVGGTDTTAPARLEIQVNMITNAGGEAEWFTICSSPINYGSLVSQFNIDVHTHIILDAGIPIRGRFVIGNGNTFTPTTDVVSECVVVSMSTTQYGEYDKITNIYSNINLDNRFKTFSKVNDKSSYVVDLYAKGMTRATLNLSTLIQTTSEESKGFQKVGKTIPYTAKVNIGSQRVGCYVFDEPISVNINHNLTTAQNGALLEVNYKCDDEETLPTIEKMNSYILTNPDSMCLETNGLMSINGGTLYDGNTDISVIRQIEDEPNWYMLMDGSTALDETMGIKTYYISDNIEELKYSDESKNNTRITKVKLNKRIHKLREKCFYNCYNLEEIDMINSDLEVIEKNALNMSTANTKLKRIVLPMTLKTIGGAAFKNITQLELFSFPYSFESIANNCLDYSPIINTTQDKAATYNKLHIRIPKSEVKSDDGVGYSPEVLDEILCQPIGSALYTKLYKLRSINSFNPSGYNLELLVCDEDDNPIKFNTTSTSKKAIKVLSIPTTNTLALTTRTIETIEETIS